MEGNESIPCHTLSYVLNQVNNASNDIIKGTDISLYVYITYSQEMESLDIQLLVNLHLIGVDNPALNFSGNPFYIPGYDYLYAYFHGRGSFYPENITFLNHTVWEALTTVSFNKCIFSSWSGKINMVTNLTIINCLFHKNILTVHEQLCIITNALNLLIYGCSESFNFYLWKQIE